MAPRATPYRFQVQLSHVDRGVYQALDVRMARHPSESLEYLATRLVAYAVMYEEGLEASGAGISDGDAPSLSLRSLDGRLLLWVDVGQPAADRLHRASKAAARVAVFAHKDPAPLLADAARTRIHKAEDVELYALDPTFVSALGQSLGERGATLEITVSDGELYVVAPDASGAPRTLSTTLRRVPLVPDA